MQMDIWSIGMRHQEDVSIKENARTTKITSYIPLITIKMEVFWLLQVRTNMLDSMMNRQNPLFSKWKIMVISVAIQIEFSARNGIKRYQLYLHLEAGITQSKSMILDLRVLWALSLDLMFAEMPSISNLMVTHFLQAATDKKRLLSSGTSGYLKSRERSFGMAQKLHRTWEK